MQTVPNLGIDFHSAARSIYSRENTESILNKSLWEYIALLTTMTGEKASSLGLLYVGMALRSMEGLVDQANHAITKATATYADL